MNKQKFAETIKKKRKALGLTQAAFAEKLGLSWITIWRWENEKQTPNKTIIDLWLNHINTLATPDERG